MPHNLKQNDIEEILSKHLSGASIRTQEKIIEILDMLSSNGKLGLYNAIKEIVIKEELLKEKEK